MDNKEYKYDAFISYRHCELDKYVAENLHKILETYELPKGIKEKLNIKGRTFKRIFRDQEELPLSSNLEDPIIEALKDSKYLIVICSPRLKDSLWCKKEIETFKKLRGRKNIFCVLVEGEPADSFPEEVLFDEKEVTTKDGKKKIEKIAVEPLAADVRGTSKKEVLRKIKNEKLRLIAPMYNLDYDDLKQRHKLREQKKIMTISFGIALFFILFSIYTSFMLIRISDQQKVLKLHQALSLASQSTESLKQDNRYDAIKNSYEALTKFNGVKMPYTSEAEYALSEALGVYDIGSSYKSVKEIKTKGVASFIKSSSDGKYVAVYDESEDITILNSKTLDTIGTYRTNGYVAHQSYSFIGNDKLAYINENGSITIVNVIDGKVIKTIDKNDHSYKALLGDTTGEYLAYIEEHTLYVYNMNEDKVTGSLTVNDSYTKEMFFSADSKYLFAGTTKGLYEIDKKEYITIHTINLSEVKEINKETYNAGYLNGIMTIGNTAYILLVNNDLKTYDSIIVSYNYIDGKNNWSKKYENAWGKSLTRSYEEGKNHIVVTTYDKVNVLDAKDGDLIESFHTDSEIINTYSFMNNELYLVFLSNGEVNYINMEARKSINYMGKYDFHMDRYSKVSLAEDGFILIPYNENRVILYEQKANKDVKEEEQKYDYPKDDSIPISEIDKVKEEYDLKSKNLIVKVLYDTDKELMFVSYSNEDLAIYSVKDKKLLKTLNKVGKIEHYFGKDKYGRVYLGDTTDAYIIDSSYNKVGHVNRLVKLEDDRLIISNGNAKYYSVKIYTLDDLLKEAKEYLN